MFDVHHFRRRSRKLRCHHYALSLNYHCLSADMRNLFLKAPLRGLFYSLFFALDVIKCAPTASIQDSNVQKVYVLSLQVCQQKPDLAI